jgi:hypothetical protein
MWRMLLMNGSFTLPLLQQYDGMIQILHTKGSQFPGMTYELTSSAFAGNSVSPASMTVGEARMPTPWSLLSSVGTSRLSGSTWSVTFGDVTTTGTCAEGMPLYNVNNYGTPDYFCVMLFMIVSQDWRTNRVHCNALYVAMESAATNPGATW